MVDWILRFTKGIFIGSGFVLPGVSGGALAAVFGVYERIISFFAHITQNFKKNFFYFLPLGLGGIAGVFLFSFVVSFLLGAYEAPILWLFIGCILGTVPTLWRQAGKEGRNGKHYFILVLVFFISLVLMLYGQALSGGQVPQNFATWLLAGALIGLGIIVPGLSPSNFLLYMGMYKSMTDGIKNLDLSVIIPLIIGVVLTVLSLSKLMNYIFKRAYTSLFHAILGMVLASTIMIVPYDYDYFNFNALVCPILCLAGVVIARWMCYLEHHHKKTL